MATNETSVRVRMVRCPKCSKVLVELPEFTLYKCGGCGTSLQAKNWKPESSGIGAPSSTGDVESTSCGVDELRLGASAPSSNSGSPEANPPSNTTDSTEALGGEEECKNNGGQLCKSEDSSVAKLNDEGGGQLGLANRDLGFVSSPGISSNEGDGAYSQSSAVRTGEAAGGGGDCLHVGSSSSPEIGGGGGDSPVVESHVSLYITSPDDADHIDLEHSPAAVRRRFSSSDDYDINNNVRDFTSHKSGSYHAYYYGSESSYDGNEDLNRKYDNNHRDEYIGGGITRFKNDKKMASDPELLRGLRSDRSSFIRSSLPPRPISRPFSSSEPDKMDLLRTVRELEDQLRKMKIPSTALHHSGGLQEEYEPCGAHTCLQCCPHSSHHHCKNGRCNTVQRGGGHGCCDISSSGSSPSPHHCCKMKRLPSKEKHKQPMKKHLLPLGGGAPFVLCYYCSELLQLPAEFVIFGPGRRLQRLLKCGSCKRVLSFSVLDGTKIVRCCPPNAAGEEKGLKVSSYRKMKSVLRDSQRTSSEERIKLSNSPLHSLMGYSSPGRVLNG